MATTITLRHVSKVFPATETSDLHKQSGMSGNLHALRDVSLTVRPGETLGVLGPSGCGKTTLLRVIAGLEIPTSGEILYDNVNLKDIPMVERGIGMVFQSYALYPHLPSVDNIGFFLRLRKREQEIPERVLEISEVMKIDLKPLLSRRPPTLSGGERQRVAIARCLARDPRVFLFDEPFSNLDAKVRASARVELRRLLQRYNVTSVYVTHDQTEAIALSHRIAILNNGQLVQIGTFQHLYETPKNVFVAGFLGSPPMNLFPGNVRGGKWIGKAFDWGPVRADISDGTSVVLGIRPEHLLPVTGGGIAATVQLVEPLYAERAQIIHARLGPHNLAIRLSQDTSIQRGETLSLAFTAERVHLFDGQTGHLIS